MTLSEILRAEGVAMSLSELLSEHANYQLHGPPEDIPSELEDGWWELQTARVRTGFQKATAGVLPITEEPKT